MIFPPRKYPRVLVVGPGRAGKDEALLWFDKNTPYASGGTTSLYLAKDVAEAKQRPIEEVYATRHQDCEFWFQLGNKLREERGILYLLKQALWQGNVAAGIRDDREIEAVFTERFVDAVLWIDNPRVPKDPTLKFDYPRILNLQAEHLQESARTGAGRGVFVSKVENHGTMPEYHFRLSVIFWELQQWWSKLPLSSRV